LTEAEKAIKELNKKKLDGRKINVELAKPREVKPKKENRNKNKKSRENVSFFYFYLKGIMEGILKFQKKMIEARKDRGRD
jgi:RNA recognition motif-containing protein